MKFIYVVIFIIAAIFIIYKFFKIDINNSTDFYDDE